uniref:Putative plant SNARE 12 n=2 Tax=Lygus hesperus TaxID=30085 RepID=A0A0A9XU73_LYGHE
MAQQHGKKKAGDKTAQQADEVIESLMRTRKFVNDGIVAATASNTSLNTSTDILHQIRNEADSIESALGTSNKLVHKLRKKERWEQRKVLLSFVVLVLVALYIILQRLLPILTLPMYLFTPFTSLYRSVRDSESSNVLLRYTGLTRTAAGNFTTTSTRPTAYDNLQPTHASPYPERIDGGSDDDDGAYDDDVEDDGYTWDAVGANPLSVNNPTPYYQGQELYPPHNSPNAGDNKPAKRMRKRRTKQPKQQQQPPRYVPTNEVQYSAQGVDTINTAATAAAAAAAAAYYQQQQ